MLGKLLDQPVSKLVFALVMLCIASLLLLSLFVNVMAATQGLASADDAHALRNLVRILGVDHERNVPTWFASSLLLSAGVLASLIGLLCFRHGLPWKAHWLSIGLLFLLMSLDESASLHERLILPLRALFGAGGFLYYAWVVPGAIVALLLSAVYLRFVVALPSFVRLKVIASAAIFLGGALGVEMVGGLYLDHFNDKDLVYVFITTIEEGMEMLGAALFIYALLRYCEATFSWQIGVKPLPLAVDNPHDQEMAPQPDNRLPRRNRVA